MRTGKTRTIIDNADLLYRRGLIRGVLVLAPNGVHTNWVTRELPRWSWDEKFISMAYWSSRLSHERNGEWESTMDAMLDHDHSLRWLAVNDEALINERCQKTINQFRRACGDRILLVADESSLFRRPGARRTMLARGLAKKLPFRRILDGTALFNSPLHAFSQFEIVQKGALGFTVFKEFKKRYAVYETQTRKDGRSFPALREYINMDELRERMARWSSVVLREDVDDMPNLLRMERDVVLSDRQAKAYRDMVEEELVQIGDQEISPVHGADRVMKLQQILGGFLLKKGVVHSIDDRPPILDALEREVSETRKAIIWCRFREDIRRVVQRLREMGRDPREYHGGVSPRQREEAIDLFMNDASVTDFVGQPQAGGRGLNLSAAELVLWYSSTPDAIIKAQADERGTQVGGRDISLVTFTTPGTISEAIIASNAGKVALADAVSGRGLRDLLRRTRI